MVFFLASFPGKSVWKIGAPGNEQDVMVNAYKRTSQSWIRFAVQIWQLGGKFPINYAGFLRNKMDG
jgi:hypothetical protein